MIIGDDFARPVQEPGSGDDLDAFGTHCHYRWRDGLVNRLWGEGARFRLLRLRPPTVKLVTEATPRLEYLLYEPLKLGVR
jgi:hypothetical protein